MRTRQAVGVTVLVVAAFSSGVATGHYAWPLAKSFWRTYYDPYYAERVSDFESIPGTADIVMLGDSLTDGGYWNELLPGFNVINRGINGDTSAGVLKRLPEVVRRKPKVVVLMIGANDLTLGTAAKIVAQNIMRIVRSLRENQIQVVLESVLLMHAGSRANRRIEQLDSFLRKIAEDQAIPFLDLNATLAPGGALLPDFSPDGEHLAGRGYVLWGEALRPLLRRLTLRDTE